MAARYQHLSPVFLADAVKKLDQVFGGKACARRGLKAHPLAKVALRIPQGPRAQPKITLFRGAHERPLGPHTIGEREEYQVTAQ